MRSTVTLNSLALRPSGSGVQSYIANLMKALPAAAPDLRFRAVVQDDAAGLLPDGVEAVVRPRSDRVRRAVEGMRSVGPADLVHGLDVDLPLRPGAPTVATVHDLTVFDMAWTTDRLRARGERFLVSRSIRRADAVIAVSRFTAERVLAHFGRTAAVIHEAADPGMRPPSEEAVAALRRVHDLPEVFVLHVGNIEARKNIGCLASACSEVGVPLVLAGARWGRGVSPGGVRTLGYVPAEDLPALYGAATVCGFPSYYEGFGLPPLEAMACGTPVVASRIPTFEEVLGGAADLEPPARPDAWAERLRVLLADPDLREERSQAGYRRAAAFSWAATAQATVGVYRSLGL